MKLIIQIPCFNEQQSIAQTIRSLPTKIDGIDEIDVVVVDDGSTDGTVQAACATGNVYCVKLARHLGLADAFSAGVHEAMLRNADILVNTDADMQYPSDQIPALVAPLLQDKADMAIGDRLSAKPVPFGPVKMLFEKLGSQFVRMASGLDVADAASGFRALNREAMQAMFIHGRFTYTLESLILAGHCRLRLVNVPIPVNRATRHSRLFRNIPEYCTRSAIGIIRAYLMYYPLKFFCTIGMLLILAAFALGIRYLYFFLEGSGGGHLQSLLLLTVLAFGGFISFMIGFLGDVIAANRRLIESIRLNQLKTMVREQR